MGPALSDQGQKDDNTLKRYIQLFLMIAVMALITMALQGAFRQVLPLQNFFVNWGSFVLIFFVLLAGILHFVTVMKHRRR